MTLPLRPGEVHVEPHPRRVQGFVDGEAVIDTEAALLVHRPGVTLAYAFPVELLGDLPRTPVPEAPGFAQVPWDAVETWVEEGRELVYYPPNPYHRVDCRPTRRRLRVEVDGSVLVDTDDTVILFETGLAPRLYVDPIHVRADLLERSDTRTYCNYKGWATYFSVVGGPADAAWTYAETLPESRQVQGRICFDASLVDVTADLPGQPTWNAGSG